MALKWKKDGTDEIAKCGKSMARIWCIRGKDGGKDTFGWAIDGQGPWATTGQGKETARTQAIKELRTQAKAMLKDLEEL